MIEYVTDWRTAGACVTSDPDLFFPVSVGTASAKQVSRALRICERCQVKEQCLDFAMQTGEADGIWGGTTPEERVKALRARNRQGHRTWEQVARARAS